jgi:signal transduction histidine kinase
VVAASWVIYHKWGGFRREPFFELATLPVIYSLGGHHSSSRSLAGIATMFGAVAVTDIRDLGFFGVRFAVVWLSGHGVRAYRRQSAQQKSLAARLEAERAAVERLAVTRERQRMAVELHDSIADALSIMVVHAGGAEQLVREEPDRARAALVAVQDTRARLAVLNERARVARELHDSLAHAVNVMVLHAGAAEQVLLPSPDRAGDAVRVVEFQGRQAPNDLCRLLGLFDGDVCTPPPLVS